MKNKHYTLIKDAYKLYKSKRYNDAILILERLVSTRMDDSYPYFLLSLSYLMTNRFSDVDLILKRLRMIDPEYLPSLQLEAFLVLKSAADIKIVLSKYIDLLEKYPNEKLLKRILNNLHKVKDFSSFQHKALLIDFVYLYKPLKSPKLSKTGKTKKRYFIVIATTVVVVIVVTSILLIKMYLSNRHMAKEFISKNQVDLIFLDSSRYDLIDKIKKKKTPIFYYSNEKVLDDFNRAKRLIKEDEYNEALILLNKIYNSNANLRVKERVDFLIRFILNIEDRKYSVISFREVSLRPYLYKGLFIKLKGRVANLKIKDNRLVLNLLIDYKKDDIFTGIIDVYSEKYLEEIKNGDMIDVEAVFIYTIGNENRMYLVAKKINKII